MIVLPLILFGFGVYFLVRGDGPARIVGVLIIVAATIFGGLMWVALNYHIPPAKVAAPASGKTHG
jgi:drug/metabolite transporter (DMT)-like permease